MKKLLLMHLWLLVLLPMAVQASTIQLPQSGQAATYSAGDDGDIKAGTSWPSLRFSDNRNGTFSDKLTGLVWSQDANPIKGRNPGYDMDGTTADGAVTWQHALDYIKKLNAENYLGNNDWRLPNLVELASLLNLGQAGNTQWLASEGFYAVEEGGYWSSTNSILNPQSAWTVNINAGPVTFVAKNNNAYVWPVRSGKTAGTILLPKTGQSACFDSAGTSISCAGTGQDGKLQAGTAWPIPRFSDNGDQTVTDNLTGLTWATDANLMITRDPLVAGTNGTVTWQGAIDYVTKLNTENYLGYSDWRLPNRIELASVINYAEAEPSVWLSGAGIRNVMQSYWSSGTAALNSRNAWTIDINGAVIDHAKLDSVGGYVWPVRGGARGAAAVVTTQSTSKAMVMQAAVALSITTATLQNGTVGTAYSQALAATGGTTPYSWSRTSGSLPAGLTLSTAGVISGAPTTAATSTFTVQVKDAAKTTATKSLSITIGAAPLSITTTSLADGYLTTAYSQTLAATGGKTAYTWSITSGTLPAGLSLAASTGVISGTSTAAGTSNITVQLKDANNTIVTKALSISVYALPSITTTSLPGGSIGTAYSQSLVSTGGKTPYTWSISVGTLPAGLTLNASSGVISGTPTTAVSSSVTFKLTDANAKTATKSLSIVITAPPPVITTTSLPDGGVSVGYNYTLTAIGGKTPYTWSRASGALPAGLTLSSAGVISGTPTTEGTSTFTVQVKDANNATNTKVLTLTVAPPFQLATWSLNDGYLGAAFSQSIQVVGGKAPYTWSITSGSLPSGLALDPATGEISGIPTSLGSKGFTIKVTDGSNSEVTLQYSLAIKPSVSISPILHDYYVGVPDDQALQAIGGEPPYTWSVVQGSLPAGLSLYGTTNLISGTPISTGQSNFTIQVKDATNNVAERSFTLNVTRYATITGTVTDNKTGASLPGATVSLDLAFTGNVPANRNYTCNNVGLPIADYNTVSGNDGFKVGCSTGGVLNTMQFNIRNPYGSADPFAVSWNGISSMTDHVEFLAQSFKPNKSGLLNKVSFYLPYGTQFVTGSLTVQLKRALGGDRNSYLAKSTNVLIGDLPPSGEAWVDFVFSAPVAVTAGEQYYVEIQGGVWSGYVLGRVEWGDGVAYQDGNGFQKQGGLWQQLPSALAFRSYVDNVVDVAIDPAGATYYEMSGGPNQMMTMYAYDRVMGQDLAVGKVPNNGPDILSTRGGFSYNGDDLTINWAALEGFDHFYDENGWLQLKIDNDSNFWSYPPNTNLVTDQFSVTFTHRFTAVTDANGAYSFSGLPAGNYNLTIQRSDYITNMANGSLTAGQLVDLNSQLSYNPVTVEIRTTTLAAGGVGSEYREFLSAIGKAPYSWSIIDGSLPAGLGLDSFGVISGTPTTAGSNTFTVEVRDSNGSTAKKALTLNVLQLAPPPRVSVSISEISFEPTKLGRSQSYHLTVSNISSVPLSIWSVTRPTGPFWVLGDECSGKMLAANESCGIMIQFVPTQEGTFYDSLSISSNDPNYPHRTVILDGKGVPNTDFVVPDTGTGDYIRNPIKYTISSDGIVTDDNTGLMWQRSGPSAGMSWIDADAYCKNLVMDGLSGWRLPNFLELTTVVNYGVSNPSIDAQAFPAAQIDNYWSSATELGANFVPSARVMNFAYGESRLVDRTSPAFSRCVRGTPLAPGPTYGLPTGEPDLIDSNTGLMWMNGNLENIGFLCSYGTNCRKTGWEDLKEICGNIIASPGYGAWRAPTIKELATFPAPYTWSVTPSLKLDDLGNPLVYIHTNDDLVTVPKAEDIATYGLRCVSGGNLHPRDAQTIAASPAVLDFGTIDLGGQSTSTVKITNTGKGNLIVGTIDLSATGFSIQSDSCSLQSLAAGAFCNVSVRFSPVVGGTVSATLNIPSNDLDHPNMPVTMIGSSIMPPAKITGPTVSEIGAGSAIVLWSTDQQTSGLVEYGETSQYGTSAGDTALTAEHVISLANLKPSTLYHYRVGATNANGIVTYSDERTFTTPAFSAKHLGDVGNVAIMEVVGDYNADMPDSLVYTPPRQAIAREYIRTHNDDNDFLVFVSTFDYAMSNSGKGFYLDVKNDTTGIGKELMDYTSDFGSAGKLQGTVDMGNISALAANPHGPLLDENVTVLNHELMHRFGIHAVFKNPDGTINQSLLGEGNKHWSYLLDTKGSFMYGNAWKDNGDGTFTSTAGMAGYSPLDLYLMGMVPKEQVPPMLLIDNPMIDRTKIPEPGATISGTARTVAIEDIVAALGERVPNADASPKKFSIGFVLLTRPGVSVGTAPAAIEILRTAWAGKFAELTRGIGGANGVTPSLTLNIDTPADGITVTGPDVTVTGTVINTTGAETGVTVNGVPATITGSRFVANHVRLQEGANAIEIKATDANGLTSTVTRSVTAQSGNYLRISSNINSGTGPLDIALQINGSFVIANPSASVAGPVAITLTPGANAGEFTTKLTVEGTYTITASAVGPDGTTYADSVTITVISKSQLETLLKAKWDGMKARIAANDVDGAVAYFAASIQQEYKDAFTEVGSSYSLLKNELNPIELVSGADDLAKCRMMRTEQISDQPQDIEYIVHYIRENGIWKLRDF